MFSVFTGACRHFSELFRHQILIFMISMFRSPILQVPISFGKAIAEWSQILYSFFVLTMYSELAFILSYILLML